MKEFANTKKGPQYFSFFLEYCEMIALLDNESAGRVIYAITDYFIDGKRPEELKKNEMRVFNRVKFDADKSCEIWLAKVREGKCWETDE